MRHLSEWPADCLLLIADQLPKDRDLSAMRMALTFVFIKPAQEE